MARQVVVIALVLLAVVQAYAVAVSAAASAPASSNSDDDLAEAPTGNAIGTLEAADAPSSVLAAPIGGPVPPGAFDNAPGSSDASTLHLSAAAGAAALAGFFYF